MILRLILILFLTFSEFNCFSQHYSSSNDEISNILLSRVESIGRSIVSAVKDNQIKAYKKDLLTSLDSIELSRIKINEKIYGLNCLFKDNGDPESSQKNLELKGISPLQNFMINDITLGIQPIFYVKIDDVEKIISENDFKLIVILANLMFSVKSEILSYTPDSNDIRRILDDKIRNYLISNNIYVDLTENYLQPFNRIIIESISGCYEEIKDSNFHKTITGLYYDSNLTRSVSNYDLYYYLPEKIEERLLIDSFEDFASYFIVQSSFFKNFKTLLIHKNTIGLKYKENQTEILLYIPKSELYKYLPKWIIFILDNYLNNK